MTRLDRFLSLLPSPPRHGATRGMWLVLALLLLPALGGCDEQSAAPTAERGGRDIPGAAEVVNVTLAPATVQPLPRLVEVIGSLHGDEQATISTKVSGRIQHVGADVGDRVREGDVLAIVGPTDYELAVRETELAMQEALARLGLSELPAGDFDVSTVPTVRRAAAQAANVKARLERAQQLFKQTPPLISEQDYADLQTAYEVAERDHDVAKLEANSQLATARTRFGQLQVARQRLADTTIRVPAITGGAGGGANAAGGATSGGSGGGRGFGVTRRLVSVGEYIGQGQPMFELVADDPIKYRAAVPQQFVKDLRPGQPAEVHVAGYAAPFLGQVSRINPAIDPQSRSFEVEVLIDNADGRLRPGAFARGFIEVGIDPEVTFVPVEAVVSFAGVNKVFTVENGAAVEHRVTLGERVGNHIAIREGLKAPAEVVITGLSRLAGETPVKINALDSAPGPDSQAPLAE